MSLVAVTWQQLMDEWHNDPPKLLAWLTKLFWDAEIDPTSPAKWFAQYGKLEIGESHLGHSVLTRLCSKCAKHIRWKSVTNVPENECQCICHKSQGDIEFPKNK